MSALSMAAKAGMRWTLWARLLIVAEVALTIKRHLDRLDTHEKSELQQLVRKSKGRPSNLSKRERQRLSTLVDKIEPSDLAKEAAMAAAPWRRKP